MIFSSAQQSRQSGFTLMEITISVVLLGILGMVSTAMFTGSFYTTKVISTQYLAYSEARYAMERMTREIREIQSAPSRISLDTASQLTFLKSNLDGTTTPVSFKYQSPSLWMSYSTGTGTYYLLSRNISSFSFAYLDENKSATTINDSIQFIDISMTVSPADGKDLSLTTRIRLRNL